MANVAVDRAESRVAAIANPAPLGLSAFALTTFVLSAANAGLYTGSAIVIGLALFYGGLGQLCAGMWEFRTGNTFGATAFSSYGAFWIALGFSLMPLFGGKSVVDLAGGATALGVFLLGWTIFTAIMLLGTFKLNGALIAVFFFLTLTFLFLTIGALGAASGMTTLGGWLGLVTAVLAWYTALAQVLSATNSAIRLPIFPMS
ncbi:MAG TPA: acetate uptake transporter [Ktedonobacteraceae bacterium]|nr:acetate uptake transporter [Ktedonobacteraceae bacterium]